MPDINMSIFEEARRNQLVTEVDIQTQVALDDYQVQLSDIANPTQSQDNVIIDRYGEFLPHWNESLDFDTWVKMSMEIAGKQILMLRGNSSLSSASNGGSVFPDFFDDFEDGDVTDWTMESGVSFSAQNTVVKSGIYSGLYTTTTSYNSAYSHVLSVNKVIFEFDARNSVTNSQRTIILAKTGGDILNGAYIAFKNDGQIGYYDTSWHDLQAFTANTWYKFKVVTHPATDTFDIWIDEVSKGNGLSTRGSYSTGITAVDINGSTGPSTYIDNIKVRKHTATEPLLIADDTPKNITVALKSLGRAG